MPYPDFLRTAQCLDRVRLGKQRVEASQIYRIVGKGHRNKWFNHPAVRMWRGYSNALIIYYNTMLEEFARRPKKNGQMCQNIKLKPMQTEGEVIMPKWLGDKDFHQSHMSNLLRKDYTYYSQYGWDLPSDLPYVWPV